MAAGSKKIKILVKNTPWVKAVLQIQPGLIKHINGKIF